MRAITAFFLLAISGCISVAISQSGGTPTWADRWAADDAKCRGYGHDPLIDAKAYVDCRARAGERRGDNRTPGSVQPTVEQVYVEQLTTCSTSVSTSPC